MSPESAILDGIDRHSLLQSHRDLVRFKDLDDYGYKTVLRPKLIDFIRDAEAQVHRRLDSRKPTGKRYFEVPAAQTSSFRGRGEILQKLQEFGEVVSADHHQPPVVVLQAMGGQGKSQIALEYCRRSKFRYRGVFWIDATSEGTVQRTFEKLAQMLNPIAASASKDLRDKIGVVLDTIACWDDASLLVFDDYDDPAQFRLNPYLPSRTFISSDRKDTVGD